MTDVLSHLTREGWARVEGAVPADRLASLTEACRSLTDEDVAIAALSSRIVADKDVMAAFLAPRVMETVVQVLGPNPILLPTITVRKNVFVDWHVDGAFRFGLAGTQERPKFLQCAIYLTPNRTEGGGGLSVVPHSHRRVEIDGEEFAPASTLSLIHSRHAIESDPGDLVIWDARLLHASSVPPAHLTERFGLFISFASQDAPVEAFLAHVQKRSLEDRSDRNARENARYKDALALDFPDGFDPDAVAIMTRSGVSVAGAATASRGAMAVGAAHV